MSLTLFLLQYFIYLMLYTRFSNHFITADAKSAVILQQLNLNMLVAYNQSQRSRACSQNDTQPQCQQ